MEALAERGYLVLRDAVPHDALDRALRHIHLDLVRRGLPGEWISKWIWDAHWFPHLRWDDEIVGLVESLPAELREGEQCDPQIVLQPPDEGEAQELTSHTDREPEWAAGRRYARIVGVPLTRSYADNGGLHVWPFGGG